ncbi:MAG TPA: RsmE family RNA methyltransferase [Bryobacteraceae bacterium]|nr:RsmE family RNA methyltransferase [Bryobacteraceae bacterium]
MARRRFFVEHVRAGHASIAGEEAHHLTRVLRVEKGQKFEISDNESVYLAQVEAAHKSLVDFVVLERLPAVNAAIEIRLYAALVRFERFELMIEKATELGVSAIIPVIAERSEKGLEQAVSKRLTRWNRIAREASEQSRRLRLPQLDEPMRFSHALNDPAFCRYFLDESGAPPILSVLPAALNSTDSIALLTGPEGGWTDRERSAAAETWTAVSLGPQILKAETAALAALAILNAWCARPGARAMRS